MSHFRSSLLLVLGFAFAWLLLWTPAARAEVLPETVTVGTYVNQIPELDVKTNTFVADFYLWFRWKGKLDPSRSFEFMNALDRTNLWKEASYRDPSGGERPEKLPDGTQYQEFHVQGRFAQPYLLADYPLDKQQVALYIEDKLFDTTQLRYVADKALSKVSPSVTVPGWVFQSFLALVTDSHYDTNFGDPSVQTTSGQSYSRAGFIMHVSRPISSILAKTVLPVLIVLLIAFSALLLKSKDIEARATLTITALISAVALHYSDMTELPPTGYLTLLDQIYILAYLLIFAATVMCIGAYRLDDAEKPALARKLDRASLVILLSVAIFGGGGIIWGH